MPGLRDNETVQIRINSWGSIIQEESKFDNAGADAHYYKVKSASGDKDETIWGDHFFLRAVVQAWPGAEGVMQITRINRERYDAQIIEQGNPGPPQMMQFAGGQMQQVPMPGLNGTGDPSPAPVAPVAPVGAPTPPPAAPAPSAAPAPAAASAAASQPDTAEVIALMEWSMSASYELWDNLCGTKLGDYDKDDTFWINTRTTADVLFIHCTRTGIRAPSDDGAADGVVEATPEATPEAAAKAAAAKMIAGAMDGEVVEAASDNLPF